MLTIAQRDVIKLVRDRPRLAVNLAFPVLLIAGLGGLLQATVGRVTGLEHGHAGSFTGVFAASLFQSAAAGMISIVEDRENDFSRELFIAPVARMTLLAGKVTGESAVAVCQGAVHRARSGSRWASGWTGWQAAGLAGTGLACCLLGAAFGLATIAALPNAALGDADLPVPDHSAVRAQRRARSADGSAAAARRDRPGPCRCGTAST